MTRRQKLRAGCVALLVVSALWVWNLSRVRHPSTPEATALGTIVSNAPDHLEVGRDCGYLRKDPTTPTDRHIWYFCDTSNELVGLLQSSSAAGSITPGALPSDLTEWSPTNQPAPWSTPTPVMNVDTEAGCETGVMEAGNAHWENAGWNTGVVNIGNTSLIFSQTFCRSQQTVRTFNVAEWTGNGPPQQQEVFSAPGGSIDPRQQLGSPVISGSYLYLFASDLAEVSPHTGSIFVARVSLGARPLVTTPWREAANYQWWTGSDWSASYTDATPIVEGPWERASSIDFYPTFGSFRLLSQNNQYAPDLGETTVQGTFNVYEADTPTGPWKLLYRDIAAPGCISQTVNSNFDACRALIGHPELSTARELLFTFYSPSTRQVTLARMPK